MVTQYYGKKSSVMVKVPKAVKKEAIASFNLITAGFKSKAMEHTATGYKRAVQLSTQDLIPIQDLIFMRNWFARHKFASYPSYLEWEQAGKPMDNPYFFNKRGIYAWVCWGGNAAYKWVNEPRVTKLIGEWKKTK
mgnify:CR=1 FL=1